jgi:hypothetical protein
LRPVTAGAIVRGTVIRTFPVNSEFRRQTSEF